ncbi:ubiquitin domain-containing protein 1 [Hyalella azteca]|uniref:Ubiquitin domain-containing protein 1 n=1 Tax=Hyalella azteca TaxID=294128 RepID=A0A8B7NEH4_HYAAZ|nr:ubiquitin domain-containing protein 1 [Hyalella azteca]
MGGCIGNLRNRSPSRASSVEPAASVSSPQGSRGVGKNVSLRHEAVRWKSDLPLTEKQIQDKREEFWDTAPAFDGRKEIWDALKAAATAFESEDYGLAQAIVDGANITLPYGGLTDCYDELGTRYQLPVYCLSLPVNVVAAWEKSASLPSEQGGWVAGEEIVIKVRLSTTSKDIKLPVHSLDTIAECKQLLKEQEDLGEVRQRWFYGGILLPDRFRINEFNIPHNHVIQSIITDNV